MTCKILVADDDFDNRTIATEILEAHGYMVCQATNGLEAVETALREGPSVILLDLSMPKMDGWQTVRQLKSRPETKAIPVIAFTAHAMPGDDKKALAAGCNAYLTKPCSPRLILENVARWLPKQQCAGNDHSTGMPS